MEDHTTILDFGAAPAVALLAVTSFGLSDRGRVRPENEDHFLVAELRKALQVRQSNLQQPPLQYGDEQGHLFLVADGMGGHRAGDLASALAVEVVEQFALNRFKWFDPVAADASQVGEPNSLPEAIQHADDRLYEESLERPELRGMGTTLTLAYSLGAWLYVVHAGDSRCYLARGGRLNRLTRDHTLVAQMVHEGQLTRAQAARHRLRHVVVNVVGGGEHGVRAEAHRAPLYPGDVLLLCSDGLTEMISDDQIARVLAEETVPEAACRRLVAEANNAGGRDNITVIVVHFAARSSDPKTSRGEPGA